MTDISGIARLVLGAAREIGAGALALAALTLSAAADPPFQAPSHLPMPNGGHHTLPIPHPRPLPVTYYMSCTHGVNPVLGGHLWTVTNVGRNTVPMGLAFEVVFGSMHADFTMPHPLGPGESAQFTNSATPYDHKLTDHDVCDVAYDH